MEENSPARLGRGGAVTCGCPSDKTEALGCGRTCHGWGVTRGGHGAGSWQRVGQSGGGEEGRELGDELPPVMPRKSRPPDWLRHPVSFRCQRPGPAGPE